MIEPLPFSYSLLLAERFEYKWEWVEAIAQLKLKEGDRLPESINPTPPQVSIAPVR
jgi:hypothetical protein